MAQRTDPMKRTYTAELCRRNALSVLKLARTTHPDAGFDATGVRWLANHIEVNHHHLPDETTDEFVHLMGCFYGECLRTALGGRWEHSGERLGILVPPHGFTYPFTAIAGQLAYGAERSISTAFLAAVGHAAHTAA